MRHLLLTIVCIAVLCGILVAGLWPFHSPRNEVTWLKDRNGLRFGDYGTVRSAGALGQAVSGDPQSCSIELWLRPGNDYGGTILTLYAADNSIPLSLHQSLADLMLQSGRWGSSGRAGRPRIYFSDVFRAGQPMFVSITSGLEGISAYTNGTLLSAARGFRPAAGACSGRLIVGDSPHQQDTWSGQVMGLAIYASELSPPTVLRHHDTWTKNGRPEIAEQDRATALYLFDERAGDMVHNHAGPSADLLVPATYSVVDKIFLEPFWDEFHPSWNYWENLLKNIVGFVPLGLCFCPYFTLVRKAKRAGLVTVAFGFAVSLTIEVFQGFLPTRDSGTTDLFTNTLGTWIGVMLYYAAVHRRARWYC
jgi:VanZ family protein